jgi:HD-GYP domain-containing protein (c-di-GMP phosphodiesterase class II)
MNKNIFLYELLTFDTYIENIISYFNETINVDFMLCYIYAVDSNEALYQYASDREFFKEIFPPYEAKDEEDIIPFDNNKFIKYKLVADEKIKKENFELVVMIFSRFDESNKIGYIHFSIPPEYRKEVISTMDNPALLTALEMSFITIQQKIFSYNQLNYSINFFLDALARKDVSMPYHMSNVSFLCTKLGLRLGLDKLSMIKLSVASIIHDVGKLYFPDELINKDGKLTDEEYETIKKHSTEGETIARMETYGMELLTEVPSIIRHHHEHYDGKGYPDGMKGQEIPYLSRVINVCDAIDAMLSKRSYKRAFNYNEVVRELAKCSGRQFDPGIAKNAIKMLVEENEETDLALASEKFSIFVPEVNLNLFFHDKPYTYSGNLVLENGNGKIIVKDPDETFYKMTAETVFHPKLCFFHQYNFCEYEMTVNKIKDNEIVCSEFKNAPSVEYIAISFEFEAILVAGKNVITRVKVVKLGGSSLIIELDEEQGEQFEKINIKNVMVGFQLTLNDEPHKFTLNCAVTNQYSFKDKLVIILEYANISEKDRDKIIKILYDKQIESNQERNMFRKVLE